MSKKGTAKDKAQPSDTRKPAKLQRTRTQAWWTSVLAGQVEQSHPTYGTDIQARTEGDTLVITGVVPSEREREHIEREVEHLRAHGVAHVRNDLRVVSHADEQEGLLAQTLIGIFETEEQAGYAVGYLQGHASFRPKLLKILAPDATPDPTATLRALLPAASVPDAQRLLSEGKTLLIVLVDEVDAFAARELLDEETRSVQTLVLPPEPMRNAALAEHSLQESEAFAGGSDLSAGADGARKRGLDEENALHAP